MPFHLPPLSRRQFLRTSLAAGAGLVLGRDLWAEPAPVDPHTWALLSDTHISGDRTWELRDTNMAANLTRAVGEVCGLPKRPAHVLVNGDCALVTGEPEDYATFTELVQPIRAAQMPIHLTMGNHDGRNAFKAGVAEAKSAPRIMEDRFVSIVRTERVNWFLLDTLDQTNVTPGLLGAAQIAWLARALDANADKPAIVVSHHNPSDIGWKGGLTDTPDLLRVIVPRKQVKAHVFGHTHRWLVDRHDSGILLINLPPVAYVFVPERPNGWVQATVQPQGLRVQLNCHNRKHPQHGEVHDLKWRAG